MNENKIPTLKSWEINADTNKVLSMEELMDPIYLDKIEGFSLEESYLVSRSDSSYIEILQTDLQHPFVFHKNFWDANGTIGIHPGYFKEHTTEVEFFIKEILTKITNESISLFDQTFITDANIQAIASNPRFMEIGLGTTKKPFSLNKKVYLTLKENSHIEKIKTEAVEPDLLGIFGDIIDYNNKMKILGQPYFSIEGNREMSIASPVIDYSNLQYLPSTIETINFRYSDYDNMKEVIDKVNALYPNMKFNISIDYSKPSLEDISNFKCKDKIFIMVLGERTVSLEQYEKLENKLWDFVNPILNSSLSPYEKYTYVYNKVKTFKKYKENKEDRSSARNLYEILTNDYIVCVGFKELLCNLLNKIGIPNKTLRVTVDTSKRDENINSFEKREHHARVLTYLKDEKYGIDGYYISDPTWDNDLENDLYNNIALTPEEDTSHHRMLYFSDIDFFNVHTIEEFIDMVQRVQTKGYSFEYSLNFIKALDPIFYESLLQKYLPQNPVKPFKEVLNTPEFIIDIFNYLKERCNKPISGKTIIDAAMEVKKFENPNMTNEEYEETRKELIEVNANIQSLAFPPIIKKDNYGNEEVIANSYNKFLIEDDGLKNTM